MIMLIWIGGLFMGIGGLLSLLKRINIKPVKPNIFFLSLFIISAIFLLILRYRIMKIG